jgi:muramoyltetrapeptide carboxypeptidase
MKKTANRSARMKSRQVIFPPSLAKGDTIGLIAPAGSIINKSNFSQGIRILEKKGFKIKYNRQIVNTKGYLSGSDQERADEFNRLWSDPEVKGLVAARGGYGSMRMIHLINMKQIQKNAKILVGFSDLSVLLTAISQKTGLVTYHGPVVTTLASINKLSQASFFNVLMNNSPPYIKPVTFKILKEGNAKGVLIGGNLTTLVHTIGTPYEIPWHQAILFIEDIGEPPYRLDRLLTHLSQAGRLQKIKGLILGTFADDERKENGGMLRTVQKRVLELLAGYDMPVWTNLPVGHSRRNITLPIGVEVEMDSNKNMLRFL